MIFCAILDKVLLMISSSKSIKEAWGKIKKIYLGTKFSKRFTILKNLWQSCQEENKSIAIYINNIVDIRT